MSDSSDVGYGKPPKHSRFRKGVSGNVSGRPRGKRNSTTVLKEILEEKIVIEENGKRKTVTKCEAALKKLVDQATSGDVVSLRQMIALVRSAEEHALEPPAKQLSDVDLKIMQRVLQRQRRCVNGETGEDQ
jgi:uncharacterized protein DUF5681